MRKVWIVLALVAVVITFGLTSQDALAQGSVSGVVLNAEDQPVEGAVVTIRSAVREQGERPFIERFETAENGVFGWREVPAGMYVVQAGARQLGTVMARLEVVDGEVARIQLQFEAREERERPENPDIEFGSIVGQVVDANGDPVADAVVSMAFRAPNRRARVVGVRTLTNERGVFEFERAPEGTVRLTAVARRMGRGQETIEVVADEAVRVQIQLRGRGMGN